MKLFRVSALGLIAAAMTACASYDTDGEILTPDPVGGLRFVNAVADTGALDFRIVDVVSNAPIQVNATFRTGGSVNGVATTFMPPYQATLAGTRHVRVFLNSTNPAVASTVVYDTTVTIVAGQNYTFFLYGTMRTGSTPGLHSKVTNDVVPTIPAGQFAIRVVDLAPDKAGTTALTNTNLVDVFVDTLAIGTDPVGTPTFAASAFTDVRPYVTRAVRTTSPALDYRVAFTGAGSTTPFIAVDVPNGTVGTSTANPIAGDRATGTAITALLVPRSVAGSTAPQTAAFQNPTVLFLIDQQPTRTAP